MVPGCPHLERAIAIGEHIDELGGAAAAAGGDDQIEVGDPRVAQTPEEPLGAGLARHRQHRGTTVTPQQAPRRRLGLPARVGPGETHTGRGEHDDEGRHGQAPVGRRRPARHPERTGRAGDDEVGDAEVPERDRGATVRHELDPAEQPPGREVQHLGPRLTHQPGQRPPDEAPHHRRAGGGDGEQVRGDGRDRQPTGESGEQRRDGELGGERHRERLDEPAWTGQVRDEHRGDEEEAGGGGDRELEPEGAGQERVGQHRGRDGERQDPHPVGGPGAARRGRSDRGHGRGPDDRRFEPGQRREPQQHHEGGHPAPAQIEAAEGRPGHGEDEGDVLAGHDEQVGQPRGPEVVGHHRRLAPVVAEHEPPEQRPGVGRQVGGAPEQEAAEAVQRGEGLAGRVLRLDRLDAQSTDDVADGEPRRTLHRRQPTRHEHPIAGEPLVEHPRGRSSGPGLEVAGAVAHPDPERALHPLRI